MALSVALATGSIVSFLRGYKYLKLSQMVEFATPVNDTPGYRIERRGFRYSILGYHDGTDFVNSLSYEYPTPNGAYLTCDKFYLDQQLFKSRTRSSFAGGVICMTLAGYLLIHDSSNN